jgi:microcystin degradation protein MlrC
MFPLLACRPRLRLQHDARRKRHGGGAQDFNSERCGVLRHVLDDDRYRFGAAGVLDPELALRHQAGIGHTILCRSGGRYRARSDNGPGEHEERDE